MKKIKQKKRNRPLSYTAIEGNANQLGKSIHLHQALHFQLLNGAQAARRLIWLTANIESSFVAGIKDNLKLVWN